MKITSYVSFLYCLCLMLASPTVQASEVRTAIFEGKPCINPPHVVGNYPATPFLFYIPTSGERPIKWHAENLPKGLKLDKETGIIKGKVVEKGTYKVMLKAENALGTDTQELLINIGDELLLTPPMGWNSWNTFGRHLTEELLLQTADAMVENGMLLLISMTFGSCLKGEPTVISKLIKQSSREASNMWPITCMSEDSNLEFIRMPLIKLVVGFVAVMDMKKLMHGISHPGVLIF